MSAAALVAFGLLAGCTAKQDTEDASGSGRPSASAPPSAGELVLPIDPYSVKTAERYQLSRARTILIGQCVRRFGFPFDPASGAAAAAQTIRDNVQDFGVYGNKRRYGVTLPAVAAKYGYHLESSLDDPVKVAVDKQDPHGIGKMTPALQTVLSGRTGSGAKPPAVDGEQVPDQGCVGEADTKLAEQGGPASFNTAEPVSKIRSDSFAASLTDPTVTAGFAKWSACMRGRGFDFPMPLETMRNLDLDTPVPAGNEIAMAKADVACKQETKLVEIWSGFEIRYQQKQIDKLGEELGRIKKEHEARMRVIAGILAKA